MRFSLNQYRRSTVTVERVLRPGYPCNSGSLWAKTALVRRRLGHFRVMFCERPADFGNHLEVAKISHTTQRRPLRSQLGTPRR